MIHEFENPVPVIVKDDNGQSKEGYVWYVRDGGTFENDLFCVVLCDGGVIQHYRSDQMLIHSNSTFNIKKK